MPAGMYRRDFTAFLVRWGIAAASAPMMLVVGIPCSRNLASSFAMKERLAQRVSLRAMEAANKVYDKGDTEHMKSVSDYLTHSKDVVKKHYAHTTHEEVKGARMAMDSLIRAKSAQEPALTNRNAALVDVGAMTSTSTASPAAESDSLSLFSEASSDTSVRRS